MDAFEEIARVLLENDRFWTKYSVKVNLDKTEKKSVDKPTMPRPEIDLVAFDAVENKLYLIEVKSFLDSNGVKFEDVIQQYETPQGRYKILTSQTYQNAILKRLKEDWTKDGLINEHTTLTFGLIAGKIAKNRESQFENYFASKGWFFWGPTKLKEKLTQLSKKAYENNTITIVSKLMLK